MCLGTSRPPSFQFLVVQSKTNQKFLNELFFLNKPEVPPAQRFGYFAQLIYFPLNTL